jgi:hypothetical protein
LNQRQVAYLLHNMDESGRLLRQAASAPSSLLAPPEWHGPTAQDDDAADPTTSTPVNSISQHWGWKVLSNEVCFALVIAIQVFFT